MQSPAIALGLVLLGAFGSPDTTAAPAGGPIEVLVVGEADGLPISGATVLLFLGSNPSTLLREVSRGETDASGRARIVLDANARGKELEEAYVGAESPLRGFVLDGTPVPFIDPPARRKLRLPAGTERRVRFLAPDGAPLPGLDLYRETHARSNPCQRMARAVRRYTTDAEGFATLCVAEIGVGADPRSGHRDPPSEDLALIVESPHGRIEIRAVEEIPAEVRLESPPLWTSARLIDENRQGIAGVPIIDFEGVPLATTDSAGHFRVPGDSENWGLGESCWSLSGKDQEGTVEIHRCARHLQFRAVLVWPDGSLYLEKFFGSTRLMSIDRSGAMICWSAAGHTGGGLGLDLGFTHPLGEPWPIALPPGPVDLGARTVPVPPHDSVRIRDWDLCDLPRVEVRILGPDGAIRSGRMPAPDQPGVARPRRRLRDATGYAEKTFSDTASVARLLGSEPGETWLECRGRGFARIEISAAGGKRHEVVFPRPASLSLVFPARDGPLERATIESVPPIWRREFDCAGEVRWDGVPVGIPLTLTLPALADGSARIHRLAPLEPGEARVVENAGLLPSGAARPP